MYQIHLGNLGLAPDEFRGQLTENPARRVATPPPSVVQTPPPNVQQQCQGLLAAWKAANPTLAACLTPADDANLLQLCQYGLQTNQVPQATQQIQQYVGAACARRSPPTVTTPPHPPPPTPPPTSNQPPPITPPPQQDFPGGGPSGGPPQGDTSTQPQKSFLRQVGPIVGIGLLAAVGLTYARKRLTKRRRKH